MTSVFLPHRFTGRFSARAPVSEPAQKLRAVHDVKVRDKMHIMNQAQGVALQGPGRCY